VTRRRIQKKDTPVRRRASRRKIAVSYDWKVQ
jgi:hypothetical protein